MMCQKRAQRSLPPAPLSTRFAAGIEPTLPGTKHPCTSSILRCQCGNITASKPTTTLCPVHLAGRSGPTTAANQEQQLFMRCWPAPAPSPPRFATAREDVEARRGAGPPCTFRYAHPILNHRQKAKNHQQKGKAGDSGCSVRLYPPRGSNPPLQDGRGACCPLYYDKMQLSGTVHPSHSVRQLCLGATLKYWLRRATRCAHHH